MGVVWSNEDINERERPIEWINAGREGKRKYRYVYGENEEIDELREELREDFKKKKRNHREPRDKYFRG